LLIAGGPAITIYVASLIHNPSPTSISYTTFFFLGLIAFIVLNSILVKPWKIKVQAKMATLELNYQTGVGNAEETKRMWQDLNLKRFLWDGAFILFLAFGLYFLLLGMVTWVQHIKLYLLIMFASVFLGLIFKMLCFTRVLSRNFDNTPPDNS
jgi:hypothetical protein